MVGGIDNNTSGNNTTENDTIGNTVINNTVNDDNKSNNVINDNDSKYIDVSDVKYDKNLEYAGKNFESLQGQKNTQDNISDVKIKKKDKNLSDDNDANTLGRSMDGNKSDIYRNSLDSNISINQPRENPEKVSSNVECAICMKLLIVPVTIPCGHNFCRECLEKAKEYKNLCPLCRSNMGDKQNINILLSELIKDKYPLTYAERLKEIEKFKREKEYKILNQRNNAIKNASTIPIFKMSLLFGPYFPGENFILNIYNEKFFDLIQCISPEGIFAIISNKHNHDDKIYGIHVKILEQKRTNKVFCIKCIANFRVAIYNLTLITKYDNYVASYSPIFDEYTHLNFNECNLRSISANNDGLLDTKIEKLHTLKKLLFQIENEGDINLISDYYKIYKNITNDIETNNSNISGSIKYYSCLILSRICLLCIKKQLHRYGKSGLILFNSKFKNIKLTTSEPSTVTLENFSYSLSSIIISKYVLKWKWFKVTDTNERLENITEYFLKKQNKSILALDNTTSPIIHRMLMLDSLSSSLLIVIFISIIIFFKYFVY